MADARDRSSSKPNGNSTRRSIQMEPRLQSLLIAEGRATQMIANARAKRVQLMKQTHFQVQNEIEAFRHENERKYQMKLREATQIERFRAQLDISREKIFDEMSKNFEKQRKSLVNFIVHHVIDEIHWNVQRLPNENK